MTLYRDGRPLAYLLFWKSVAGKQVVHWNLTGPDDDKLLSVFPSRPFLASVPMRRIADVITARGSATVRPIEMMENRGPLEQVSITGGTVRKLTEGDHSQVSEILQEGPRDFAEAYKSMNLDIHNAWGSFDVHGLASVAFVSVMLPEVWVLNGVFTSPKFREKGHAKSVVSVIVRTALEHGAIAGLYVNSDNAAAQRTYKRLGFKPIEHRAMIETIEDPST